MERMNVLLGKLGNPQNDLQVIHVAGTNGKGSVCKYLEEGLAACGYSVGLYTSPFIEKFNERIRLGGQDISDEDLDEYTERVLTAVTEMVEEGYDSPTEFEVVTTIALLFYKEKKADITILEVGLGGKGDSTNVVPKPMICAITSISYDHMDRLGNTLEEIAADKAGIIKPGVPVISNVDAPEAARVIARTAYEKESRLYDVSKIKFSIAEETPFSQKVSMEIYETDYSDVEVSMTGRHQGENLKTALAVIEILRRERKIKVERSRLYEGLKRAVQPGRFEVISGNESSPPIIIIDGAHNEAGAKALEETVRTCFQDKKVLLVTGMLADKQVKEILDHFVKITKDIIITEPDNPRKLSVEKLDSKLREIGIAAVKAADAAEAVAVAQSVWNSYDAVIFAGSLYLIGDVRRVIKNG
ncbi:MAG: bifunctional folylpolyglutamate synthase/dihydrofolate synthase [Lentihominibacter sp.]